MVPPNHKLNVLVSGAGVAGPAFAYFFGVKAGHNVTLVERTRDLNTKGQNIDLRGPGQEIVKIMGLDRRVREMTTTEEGTVFERVDGVVQAQFEAAKEGSGGAGPTSDVEILRGDLAEVLYQATKDYPNVKYIFGDRITHVEQANDLVYVDFESGKTGEKFDLLVAADGQNSSVREQVFGKLPGCKRDEITRHTGLYISYFTIPLQADDTKYWRICHLPNRRALSIRPDPHGSARAMLLVIPTTSSLKSEVDDALSTGVPAQRAVLRRIFADGGWQTKRLVNAMDTADDFYMQSVIQIRMPRWSSGRVVLLGDASNAPSPITGMGTTLALCGAYVLAGELAASPADPAKALEEYDRQFRPFVEKKQKITPGAPGIVHPETRWGIAVLHWIVWVFSMSVPLAEFFFRFQQDSQEAFPFTRYGWEANSKE